MWVREQCTLGSDCSVTILTTSVRADSGDEQAIRDLESRFAAAFNTKDVDAIMKVYVPDRSLFVFDVVPPRQYVGADAQSQGLANLPRCVQESEV